MKRFYLFYQICKLLVLSSILGFEPEISQSCSSSDSLFSLIDVSEVRLKISLETAPAERPHGVLGVWSPILSAIGNAFKIQVSLLFDWG